MTNKIVSSGHSLIEDIFSITQAILVFSVGVLFLQSAGLIGGGTTGLSLILSYTTDYSFGFWFVAVNAPFFLLALFRMGIKFTVMTIMSIIGVSLTVEYLNTVINLNIEYKIISAVLAGLFIGIGLLILYRHRSSMGGLSILGLYMQDNFKISAGKFQLFVDFVLIMIAFYLFDIYTVIYSAIALIILNIELIVNHKEGRYSPNKNV